jgi:hypothetical protein
VARALRSTLPPFAARRAGRSAPWWPGRRGQQVLLTQLNETARKQNQGFGELREAIERELRAMRSALRLAVGTAGLEVLQPQAHDN